MALRSNALTTLQTLKDGLGITDTSSDSKLERFINVASQAIEDYCQRSFARQTVTGELHKGHGTNRLLLNVTPVVMVLSIDLGDTAVDSSDYYLEKAASGSVFFRGGTRWTAPRERHDVALTRMAGDEEAAYSVSYIGGYVLPKDDSTSTPRTLPDSIEQAALLSAITLWRGRGKYANIVEETEDSDAKVLYDYALPPNCRALLKRYVRRV